MDVVSKIMDYEDGQMDLSEMILFFSELVKSGLVWQLQGSYGRTANTLIDNGYLKADGTVTGLGIEWDGQHVQISNPEDEDDDDGMDDLADRKYRSQEKWMES